MKNFLTIPLFSLILSFMLSMFTSCQTESINDETLDLSENSNQTSALSVAVSEKSVALFSTRNGTYISSENGGNVTCNKKEVGAWETLTMITWEDGTISFKGNNGLFLSDENGGNNIQFNREEAGLWEKFTYNGSTITRDGVSDLNGSDTNVNFNGGIYYDFDIIELSTTEIVSEKSVAIKSTRNGTYISSENGGNVTCNRREVGAWETFTMVTWKDGTISFKGNNGLFLSDENGGNNIQFNREEAGLWEKFTYNGSTITRDGVSDLNGSDTNVNFNGGSYYDFDIIEL